ncbi:hypothetical protein ACEV6Q_04035 [Enterobacter ludwigii]|uniref:hypothetical protein n=1 Tax=Enterobacter ludwigii TaxID=299767 RepID=UPI003BEEB83A
MDSNNIPIQKGQRVICISDDTKFFTPGKYYEVLAAANELDLSGTLPRGWCLFKDEFNVTGDTGFVHLTKMSSENTKWAICQNQ